MHRRRDSVTYRSRLSVGLHVGLALWVALICAVPLLNDPDEWDVVRWILLGAVVYAALACRQRLVLSSHGLRVQGMLLWSSVKWSDLRRVDMAPYQPGLTHFTSIAFAHQLVFLTHSGRHIEGTCCPGSRNWVRRIQADLIYRAELPQSHSDASLAGRHRPKPKLPAQGETVPEEHLPDR